MADDTDTEFFVNLFVLAEGRTVGSAHIFAQVEDGEESRNEGKPLEKLLLEEFGPHVGRGTLTDMLGLLFALKRVKDACDTLIKDVERVIENRVA
jgi:hypothetical protein